MNRRDVLKTLGAIPLLGTVIKAVAGESPLKFTDGECRFAVTREFHVKQWQPVGCTNSREWHGHAPGTVMLTDVRADAGQEPNTWWVRTTFRKATFRKQWDWMTPDGREVLIYRRVDFNQYDFGKPMAATRDEFGLLAWWDGDVKSAIQNLKS